MNSLGLPIVIVFNITDVFTVGFVPYLSFALIGQQFMPLLTG